MATTSPPQNPHSRAAPPGPNAALRSVHTANLPAVFAQLQSSLAVSTYQTGKVILIRADDGQLNTHSRSILMLQVPRR